MNVNQAGHNRVASTRDDRRGCSFGATHHDILDVTIRHDDGGSIQHVSRRGDDPGIHDQEIGLPGRRHRRSTATHRRKNGRRNNPQIGHRVLCHRSLRGGGGLSDGEGANRPSTSKRCRLIA